MPTPLKETEMAKETQNKIDAARPLFAVAGAGDIAYKKARAMIDDFDAKAARARFEEMVAGLQKQAVDYQAKAAEGAKSIDTKATRAKLEALVAQLQEQAKALPGAVEGLVEELQEQAKTWPAKAQGMVSDFDAKAMQTKAGEVYSEIVADLKKTLAEISATYASLAEHGESVVTGKPEEPAPKKATAEKATAKKAAPKSRPPRRAPPRRPLPRSRPPRRLPRRRLRQRRLRSPRPRPSPWLRPRPLRRPTTRPLPIEPALAQSGRGRPFPAGEGRLLSILPTWKPSQTA